MCGDQVTITCHVEPKSTAALTTQGSTKVWLLDLAAVCLDGSDPCPGLLGKTNARFVERVRGRKHCGLAHTHAAKQTSGMHLSPVRSQGCVRQG